MYIYIMYIITWVVLVILWYDIVLQNVLTYKHRIDEIYLFIYLFIYLHLFCGTGT